MRVTFVENPLLNTMLLTTTAEFTREKDPFIAINVRRLSSTKQITKGKHASIFILS